MQCEKCGKQLMDNASFCTSCGWKTDRWRNEVRKTKSDQQANILVISICAIAVSLFIAYILANII